MQFYKDFQKNLSVPYTHQPLQALYQMILMFVFKLLVEVDLI